MNSFIKWVGGKKILRKRIIEEFPEKIDRYIEVFGGAGWVLFGAEKIAKEEIYNDKNGNLVNLFRCVKYHNNELKRELGLMLNSREQFCNFKEQLNCESLTDIQRAARFYILIEHSFGAKLKSFSSGVSGYIKKIDNFEEVAKRLSRVVIENRDFESIINTYDKDNALFYLDPPYHGTEKIYQEQFSECDHIRLRDRIGNISGKFVVSYNNDEFIKKLYEGFNIIEVERSNNLSNISNSRYKELIIKNY